MNAAVERDRASRRLWIGDGHAWVRATDGAAVGGKQPASSDGFAPERFDHQTQEFYALVFCVSGLSTLVNPQKITLTCQIVKIALRACDVGIPFAADRHSAPTPCRSSRKPRGVVMAHAVRKDTVPRRPSRSLQIRPADAIHKYVKAPLIGLSSKIVRCLLLGG
jgi:hypothetical protein